MSNKSILCKNGKPLTHNYLQSCTENSETAELCKCEEHENMLCDYLENLYTESLMEMTKEDIKSVKNT